MAMSANWNDDLESAKSLSECQPIPDAEIASSLGEGFNIELQHLAAKLNGLLDMQVQTFSEETISSMRSIASILEYLANSAAEDGCMHSSSSRAATCSHVISGSAKSSAGSSGLPVASSMSTPWELHATPAILRVPRQMVLCTSLGDFLERRGLLAPLLIMASIVCLCLMEWQPEEEIHVRMHVRGQDIDFLDSRPNWYFYCAAIPFQVLVIFLANHRMNRSMLLASLRTFDSLIVLASSTIMVVCRLGNRFWTIGRAGRYDIAWQICDVTFAVLVFPLMVIGTNIDCFRASRKVKIIFTGILCCNFATSWIVARCFDGRWGEPTNCSNFDIGGVSRREVYLGASCQTAVFLGKALLSYVAGDSFSIIRPSYKPMNLKRPQQESQTAHPEVQTSDLCRAARTESSTSPKGSFSNASLLCMDGATTVSSISRKFSLPDASTGSSMPHKFSL